MRLLVSLQSNVLVEPAAGNGEVNTPWKILGQDSAQWGGTVATGFASGTGTSTDPYMIETAEQLAYLASSSNSGTSYSGKYINLANNIDLGGVQDVNGNWSGQQWTPINNFAGTFNGNGYSISNIYINNPSADNQGLFGKVIENNTGITNVFISSGYIKGHDNVGAVIGCLNGNLCSTNYCTNNATVVGNVNVGGIVGKSVGNSMYNNNIKYNNNNGNIIANGYVGGIIGYANLTNITDCNNTGTITATDTTYAGEIYGYKGSTGAPL